MAPGCAGSAGSGGSSLGDGVGGGVDVEGFCSFDEQLTTVSVSNAPHSATRWGYLRMPLNLCNMSAPSGPAPSDRLPPRVVRLTVSLGRLVLNRTLSRSV